MRKICIPTESNEGLQATSAAEIREAPFLTVVDLDSDETSVVSNSDRSAGHGVCHVLDKVGSNKIDAVICAKIGRGAYRSLSDAGVDVLLSEPETVSGLVQAARDGRLRPASSEEVGRGCGCGHTESHRGCRSRRTQRRHGRS